MLLNELEEPGENITVDPITHERVLVAVSREDMEFVTPRDDAFQALMADDVGIREHSVVGAGHEQDRGLDFPGVGEGVVGQRCVLGIVRVLYGSAGPDLLADVAVVVRGDDDVRTRLLLEAAQLAEGPARESKLREAASINGNLVAGAVAQLMLDASPEA